MSTEPSSGAGVATGVATAPTTGLRPNAIGVFGVLLQSVTLIGPGIAVAFAFSPGITYAGGSFPLAIALAMVIALLLAVSIGQLASHLPSAGGFYTYTSRSMGRSIGFLMGWVSIPAYMLFIPLNMIAFGFALQFGSGLPWYIGVVVLAIVTGSLAFFGVRLSIRTLVVLGIIEVVVFTLLSVFLVVHAGSANTIKPFTLAAWPHGRGGVSGVLVGAVIGVLAFTGFESAVLLAEESKNARKIIQPILLIAVIFVGAFFVFASYAGLVGYGFNIGTVSDPNSYLGAQGGSPWFTLAKNAWGDAGTIVQLVVLTSLLANTAAGLTALSRVVFAMGRSGALPSAFGRTTKRFRTPGLALLVAVPLTVVFAIWSGLVYGQPPNSFYALVDTASYCVLSTYAVVSLATPFFFLREQRKSFNVVLHLIIPILATIMLIIVLVAQLVAALPPIGYPGLLPQYLGLIIAGGWLVVGVIWMSVLRAANPKALDAGQRIYVDAPTETPAETPVEAPAS